MPFNVEISEADKIINLHLKIAKTELPGIMNRVLAGLLTLLSRGDFSNMRKLLDISSKYLGKFDNVMAFFSDEAETMAADDYKCQLLYANYVDYCRKSGYKSCGRNTFYDRLVEFGGLIRTENKTQYINIDALKKRAWTDVEALKDNQLTDLLINLD